MTKNEDILKPFEVIERQIHEVENVVEKNKYFMILFFSQLYTQLDTCQKFHPYGFNPFYTIYAAVRLGPIIPYTHRCVFTCVSTRATINFLVLPF